MLVRCVFVIVVQKRRDCKCLLIWTNQSVYNRISKMRLNSLYFKDMTKTYLLLRKMPNPYPIFITIFWSIVRRESCSCISKPSTTTNIGDKNIFLSHALRMKFFCSLELPKWMKIRFFCRCFLVWFQVTFTVLFWNSIFPIPLYETVIRFVIF